MTKISRAIRAFLADETGATAIEYGLMVSLIAAVIVLAVSQLGSGLKDVFTMIVTCISNPSTTTCTGA